MLTIGSQGDDIEEWCNSIFRNTDMLDLATDTSLPLYARKSFIRYIYGVYFTNELDEDLLIQDNFGEQIIYLLRDDAKNLIAFLKSFVSDLQELSQLYKQTQQRMSVRDKHVYLQRVKMLESHVFYVMLPFLAQIHKQNYLETLQNSDEELS